MAFVRTVKINTAKGRSHEYVRIVESYWEKGKKKQRVIANLGNKITLHKNIKQIVNGLLRVTGEKPLIFKDDIVNKAVKEFGVYYVGKELLEKLGIEGFIKESFKEKKTELNYSKWIEMMIINRLSDPTSKLGIFQWIKGMWYPEHGLDERIFEEGMDEKEYEKLLKREVMKFYRALDYTLKLKGDLEKHLYTRLRDLFSLKVDIIFYDVTSSYFEGNGPEGIAERGYSRDHEDGKNQIVIGLVMCNGFPIGHEVFEGSRKKTVKEVIGNIKKNFEIERCIFVGDRGIVSEENLEELERNEFESILALKNRRNNEVKELFEKEHIYCRVREELEYWESEGKEGIRYIVCRNPEIAREKWEKITHNLKEIEEGLGRLAKKVNERKKPSIKVIIRKVEEILSHKKGRRYFDYKIDEKSKKLSYWRKEDIIQFEEKIAGVYILRTKEKKMKAEEIIDAYRDLTDIERAFRTMKSVIDLRPFFHRTEERVRAHVLICVLAYLVEKIIENSLKKKKISLEKALVSLRQMGVAIMEVDGETYAYVSEPTFCQKEILRSLDIKLPPRVIILKENNLPACKTA